MQAKNGTRKANIANGSISPIRNAWLKTKQGKATTESLLGLIKSQEYRCQLSGILLEPSTATLDHKIPISSGGSDSIENLQWVSTEVNKAKGSMSQEEFMTMCKRVASWSS